MLVRGSVRAGIYKTTVKFSVMATYKVGQATPDFKIEYWMFKFGTISNRKRYSGQIIKEAIKVFNDMGFTFSGGIEDFKCIDPCNGNITTHIMMDLKKEDLYADNKF